MASHTMCDARRHFSLETPVYEEPVHVSAVTGYLYWQDDTVTQQEVQIFLGPPQHGHYIMAGKKLLSSEQEWLHNNKYTV